MNLFKKHGKFDYQNHYLRLVFDLKTMEYHYFYQAEKAPLPYESLNRRTQKQLASENKKLKEQPELLATELQQAKNKQRFDFLASHDLIGGGFEMLGVNKGTMSPEMNAFLTQLTKKENLVLGIHRTGYSDMRDIQNILTYGLALTGHSSSGACCHAKLSNNVSFYPDNKTIIKELMYANAYKNSLGSILIAIPDNDLDKEIYVTREDEYGNIIKSLNPKYILGYIPVNKDHHIHTIMTLDDIKRQNTFMEPSQNQESMFFLQEEKEQLEELPSKRI